MMLMDCCALMSLRPGAVCVLPLTAVLGSGLSCRKPIHLSKVSKPSVVLLLALPLGDNGVFGVTDSLWPRSKDSEVIMCLPGTVALL